MVRFTQERPTKPQHGKGKQERAKDARISSRNYTSGAHSPQAADWFVRMSPKGA